MIDYEILKRQNLLSVYVLMKIIFLLRLRFSDFTYNMFADIYPGNNEGERERNTVNGLRAEWYSYHGVTLEMSTVWRVWR